MKKPKVKTVKAWAVVKRGEIVLEDFFSDGTSLAVFPFKKIDTKSPIWGYAVYPEQMVQVTITYTPPLQDSTSNQ